MSPALLCETDTPEVRRLIVTTFVNNGRLTDSNDEPQLDFEHGQWWVTCLRTGRQWSVVDVENGVDFEVVSEGEES